MKTVLCIEDVAANVVVIAGVCKGLNLNLELAVNGREGLEKVRELHPSLVLLDIGLPDMDGLEVVHHIREDIDPTVAQVPVIAVTAHALNGDRERCLDAGCDDYLAKPYRVRDLVALFNTMLNPVAVPKPSAQGTLDKA